MTVPSYLTPFLALALTATGAAADNSEWFGPSCSFAATHDQTGVLQQNPNVHFGVLTGGPVAAADLLADDMSGASWHPGLVDIGITCWIQINNSSPSYYTAHPASTCEFTGTGVAAGACQISYTSLSSGADVGPGSRRFTDNVYMCTYITLQHAFTYQHFSYDEDDDPTNGTQCQLAINGGG